MKEQLKKGFKKYKKQQLIMSQITDYIDREQLNALISDMSDTGYADYLRDLE